MARPAHVPADLTRGPFTLDQALAAGVTRRQLQGSTWRRLQRGVYVWSGAQERPEDRLSAVTLPPGAAFAGRTAAWLHGLSLPLADPLEVIVPDGSAFGSRLGVSVRRVDLRRGDIEPRKGFPATCLPRTFADLLRTTGLVETVVLSDEALSLGLMEMRDLASWIAARAGRKGVARLRRVLELTDAGAESPMETRLRLLLVLARLPRPLTQVVLSDGQGTAIARADLYYPDQRLAIEYDGGVHRDTLVHDNRRQNLLLAAGYQLLRFTAADVLGNPARVVAQVRYALEQPTPPAHSRAKAPNPPPA